MQIRIGYELIYHCPQPTPMILTLHVHFTRVSDVLIPDYIITRPTIPITEYRDAFGNWCSRIVAPKGEIRLSANAVVNDTGEPDVVALAAHQHQVQELPEESLPLATSAFRPHTPRWTSPPGLRPTLAVIGTLFILGTTCRERAEC